MVQGTGKRTPSFKGLTWQRDDYYSFFSPIDWHRFEWEDGRKGIILGPSPDSILTIFAVDVRELGMTVDQNDLHDLMTGFMDGIKQLPTCEIEEQDSSIVGGLIILEARYTYKDEGTTRKRWVRVLYHNTRQIAFTAQGETVEAFHYWLPMFNEAMMTAKVHNSKPQFESL